MSYQEDLARLAMRTVERRMEAFVRAAKPNIGEEAAVAFASNHAEAFAGRLTPFPRSRALPQGWAKVLISGLCKRAAKR